MSEALTIEPPKDTEPLTLIDFLAEVLFEIYLEKTKTEVTPEKLIP